MNTTEPTALELDAMEVRKAVWRLRDSLAAIAMSDEDRDVITPLLFNASEDLRETVSDLMVIGAAMEAVE